MSSFEMQPVSGFRIGHFTSAERPTGCTVILTPQGAVASVDVRGAAPGTRETDALAPEHSNEAIHGLLLTGGSAFGLDAATGVMRWLEERGHGVKVGPATVPIVPAAVIFDLWHPMRHIRPDAAAGYAACQVALEGAPAVGLVGAGAGARVGKFFGIERADSGGIGYASIKLGGITMAALVVVNALGDIVNEQGQIIAGARTADGKGFENCAQAIREGRVLSGTSNLPAPAQGSNTTIGAILTDARLTKVQAKRIAQCAHDGLARAIYPVHTPMDGDTLFCVATGLSRQPPNLAAICAVAADLVVRAVRQAVTTA